MTSSVSHTAMLCLWRLPPPWPLFSPVSCFTSLNVIVYVSGSVSAQSLWKQCNNLKNIKWKIQIKSVAKHCTQNLKVIGSSPTYHPVPSSQSQFGLKLPGDPSWIKASAQEYINSINMDLTWAIKHQPLEVQSRVTDAPETCSHFT